MPATTGHTRGEGRARLIGRGLVSALALAEAAAPLPAAAQSDAPAAAPGGEGNVTVKLIELLIKTGVLSKDQASALLAEAQAEARAARRTATASAAAPSGTQATRTGKSGAVAAAGGGAAAGASGSGSVASADAGPPGSVHVTYVPPLVRQQIVDQVKQELQQQVAQGTAAAPNQIPDWVQRIKISGDLRVRAEGDFFGTGNYDQFPNFQAINTSSNGFDVNGTSLPPLLNTTENRFQPRLRARLDVASQPVDWMTTDVRIGTGNDNNPVSTNQTLGQPGYFSKYQIWLDRAYVGLKPTTWLTADVGRMPNPFWTTNLLYDDDLNFDGVAVQLQHPVAKKADGFLNAGAFPVYNTAFNFGSNQIDKTASRDSTLLAIQGGGDYKFNQDYVAKLGVGWFYYNNVQGKFSAPCLNPTAFGSCNTDNTIPAFWQFSNTVFPVRSIVQDPSNPNGAQPQFFGLASRFNLLDVHGRFDILNFHPIDIVLDADYVKNFGYNASDVLGHNPSNNLGTNNYFQSGNNAYMARVFVGHQDLDKLWDWNASIAYKYIEADSMIASFTDSNFHLGGTNAKGYVLKANLALNKFAWLSASWLAANQVSGPSYTANVLLVDLNAKF